MDLWVPSEATPSLSRAVRVARPGSTVYVQPGRYAERLTVTKPLSIVAQIGGKEDDAVILSSIAVSMRSENSVLPTMSSAPTRPDTVENPVPESTPEPADMTVHFRNVTFVSQGRWPAVDVSFGRVDLDRCSFASEAKDVGTCIMVNPGSGAHVTSCHVEDTLFGVIVNGGRVILSHTTFRRCASAAVEARGAAHVLLTRCSVEDSSSAGFRGTKGSTLHVGDSTFRGMTRTSVEAIETQEASVVGCDFNGGTGAAVVLIGCKDTTRVLQNTITGLNATAVQILSQSSFEQPSPTCDTTPRSPSPVLAMEDFDDDGTSATEHPDQAGPRQGRPRLGCVVERNTLTGCRVGVHASGGAGPQPVIRSNTLRGHAIAAIELGPGSGALVERNTITRCHQVGILGSGTLNAALVANNVQACTIAAIAVDGGAGGEARENTLSANGVGILLKGGTRGWRVHTNDVQTSLTAGIHLVATEAADVAENTVTGGNGPGILIDGNADRVVVSSNVLRSNGRKGGKVFRERVKVFSEAEASGIVILKGAMPTVHANVIEKSMGAGVFVDHGGGGIVRKNTFKGNGLEPVRLRPTAGVQLHANEQVEEKPPAVPSDACQEGSSLEVNAPTGVVMATVEPGKRTPFDWTYRKAHASDATLTMRAKDVRARYLAMSESKELAWIGDLAQHHSGSGAESAACTIQ